MEDEHKRSGMMTRAEWMAWLRESWTEAQGVAARGCGKGLHQAQGVAARGCGMTTIKTWRERCEEHPDHDGIVSEQMIRARMQEEIDELRQALKTEPFEYWNAVEGWVKIDEMREHFDSVGCGTIYKSDGEGRSPLYTAPTKREWVGLTEIEICDIEADELTSANSETFSFARAIEAKLKDKNT